MNFHQQIAVMVDLDLQVFNMKTVLTEKERYKIINEWATRGPVTYYNLVAQTEFYILNKKQNIFKRFIKFAKDKIYEQKL